MLIQQTGVTYRSDGSTPGHLLIAPAAGSKAYLVNHASNEVVWRYQALDNPQSFFSPHIGGCQRLSSGNTLVCEGSKGCVFEVTNDGKVVWEYVSPYTNAAGEFGNVNWLFRARHYRNDSEELIHL